MFDQFHFWENINLLKLSRKPVMIINSYFNHVLSRLVSCIERILVFALHHRNTYRGYCDPAFCVCNISVCIVQWREIEQSEVDFASSCSWTPRPPFLYYLCIPYDLNHVAQNWFTRVCFFSRTARFLLLLGCWCSWCMMILFFNNFIVTSCEVIFFYFIGYTHL